MNNERMYYSHEAEMRAAREMTKLTVILLALGLGAGAVKLVGSAEPITLNR